MIARHGDFIRIENDGTHKCCNCKKRLKTNEIYLQCGHRIHTKCINKKMLKKFGKEMNLVILNKHDIWHDLDENCAHNKMYFGTRDSDGIIECNICNTPYSILSPIYREFGIPKKIEKIILLNTDNGVVSYHICTAVDLLHLSNPELQHMILKNFDYHEESNYVSDVYDTELEKKEEFIFRSYLNKEKNKISYQECEVGEANDKDKEYLSLDSFVDYLSEYTPE